MAAFIVFFFLLFSFRSPPSYPNQKLVPVQNAEPRRRKRGKPLYTAARDSLQQFSTATILQEHFRFGHLMGENVAAIISTVCRVSGLQKPRKGEKTVQCFTTFRHFSPLSLSIRGCVFLSPPPPIVFPFCNLKHPPLKNDAANYST